VVCYKLWLVQAIAKYLKAEFNLDNSTALKTALKKGVKDALLVQVKWPA